MLTPRNLAIVAAAAGAFAGLPLSARRRATTTVSVSDRRGQRAGDHEARAGLRPRRKPRRRREPAPERPGRAPGDKPAAKAEQEASQAPPPRARQAPAQQPIRRQGSKPAAQGRSTIQRAENGGTAPVVPALPRISPASPMPSARARRQQAAPRRRRHRRCRGVGCPRDAERAAGGVQDGRSERVNELDLAAPIRHRHPPDRPGWSYLP
jgi:hypothetical protein